MATKISGSIFEPCFLASLNDEKLFDELTQYAKQFMANPDDMNVRIRIRQFCDERKIPHPTFPSGRAAEKEINQNPFIPLHAVLENENFKQWFLKQRIVWHTHNNIHEFHLGCQCRKCHKEQLHCPVLRLPSADMLKAITETITTRGRLFVFNHRLNRCLETKIEIHNEKFRFIQNAYRFGFILTQTDILVELAPMAQGRMRNENS